MIMVFWWWFAAFLLNFLFRYAFVSDEMSEKLHVFCDYEGKHQKGNDGSDRA